MQYTNSTQQGTGPDGMVAKKNKKVISSLAGRYWVRISVSAQTQTGF